MGKGLPNGLAITSHKPACSWYYLASILESKLPRPSYISGSASVQKLAVSSYLQSKILVSSQWMNSWGNCHGQGPLLGTVGTQTMSTYLLTLRPRLISSYRAGISLDVDKCNSAFIKPQQLWLLMSISDSIVSTEDSFWRYSAWKIIYVVPSRLLMWSLIFLKLSF